MMLRPATPDAQPCKVCGGEAPLFGHADFSRWCRDQPHKQVRPICGQAVYYRRCGRCGLVFSDAFDDWPPEAFADFIYNEDYVQVDPDYVSDRPLAMGQLVKGVFERAAGDLDVLDYGGGAGLLAAFLRDSGFRSAQTYDPFTPEHALRPDGRFPLITCFETLEHLPDPFATAADMVDLLADDGLILFSTLVQPQNFDQLRMTWWYIAPRNGHITIFSLEALAVLWRRLGLQVITFDEHLHAAFRTPPPFAEHLLPEGFRSAQT